MMEGAGAVPRASWTALAVLLAVAVLNYLDRTLIGLLQIPIKAELHLSDLQLGALVGAAFGLVYTLFGLPLGALADRTSRKAVLVGAIVVWTGLTACCGLAGSFGALLVCRMGVALGEAACAPVSHSMISDLFPPRRRGAAVAAWALAVPLGVILGFLLAGWLATAVGWRRSFVAVGLGGLSVAALAAVLLREPRRGASEGLAEVPARALGATVRLMWADRTYRFILVAAGLHLFTYYAVTAWLPQLYARSFHLPLRQVGAVMALIVGGGGAVGTLIGGLGGDRLARRDPRGRLWLTLGATALAPPLALAQVWAPTLPVSIAVGVLHGVVLQVYFAPMIAVTQSLMPAGVRTFTGAVYVAAVNVVGASLGPVVAGRLSDVFARDPTVGASSLRLALTWTELGSVAALPFFLLAARSLRPAASTRPAAALA